VRYTAAQLAWIFIPSRTLRTNFHTADQSRNLSSWERLNRLSDEELAIELRAGRNDALVVLFDRYQKLVFGIAVKIVHDPGEAEEVVQTVFFDIYRSVANYDPLRGTLKVWLMQYAYGRALNRQRHLAAQHFYNAVSLDMNVSDILQPAVFPDPLDEAELSRLTEELLASLSPRRRAVLELTYFEGLTAREISARLSLDVGIVRHELYRGLAKLRKSVDDQIQPRTSLGDQLQARKKEDRKTPGKEALTTDAPAL
jgi:RNA polymerase sigma-70 factor (ECF subfamily)